MSSRYAQPLAVFVTHETRRRVLAIAEAEGKSQAQVIRDLLDVALAAREGA